MNNVCVVTGGGSGMGLEVAKLLGKNHKIILVGRTVTKLEHAIQELSALGMDAQAYPADASDRESVRKLAQYATKQGNVKILIHAAGISPHMADALKIFHINAIGTIYMDEAFMEIMDKGSCILNVSSMSAYMLPSEQAPRQIYRLALNDVTAFQSAMQQVIQSVPQEQQAGMAYTISKNFVVWYTSKLALPCGEKGIRIVSISPGTFKTPMGEVEGEQAASFALQGALKRLGDPEEIAKMMAFMVSDDCSYLTGVDILYDGGSIAAFQSMMENKGA